MDFTRDDTKRVKGLAMLLLMFHHMVGFPDRYPVGFGGFESILGQEILVDVALNFKVAISVFFFLGGYGLYKRWEMGKYSFVSNLASLYHRYWKIFLIFVPIGFAYFANNSTGNPNLATFYPFTWPPSREVLNDIVANFIGVSCSLSPSWWFLISYVCTIPAGLAFCSIAKKQDGIMPCLYAAMAVDILIRNVFPHLTWLQGNYYFDHIIMLTEYNSSFLVGVACARFDAVAAICKKIHEIARNSVVWRLGICTAGLVLLFYVRCCITGKVADLLLVPFLCAFAADLIACLPPAAFGCRLLGKCSMNLWLIHCFYTYHFEPITKLVYQSPSALVDFGILLGLTLASSIAVDILYWLAGKALQCLDTVLQYIDGRKRVLLIPKEALSSFSSKFCGIPRCLASNRIFPFGFAETVIFWGEPAITVPDIKRRSIKLGNA